MNFPLVLNIRSCIVILLTLDVSRMIFKQVRLQIFFDYVNYIADYFLEVNKCIIDYCWTKFSLFLDVREQRF